MSTPPKTPWERLREERERLGYTQTEFGKIGGVRKQAQINYEKGERKPDASYLEAIAKAGADVAYILTGQTAALRARLQDLKVATESAAMIGHTREEIAEYQTRIFEAIRAQDEDESELLTDYRKCKPPDKQVIRQMASRLATASGDDQPKKKRR